MIEVYMTQDEYEEGFKVTDDKKADDIIEEMKEIEQEHDRLIELAEAKIKDLKDKVAKLKLDKDTKTSWHKGVLNEYIKTVKTKDTTTQSSYKLVAGTLKIKHPKPSPKVDDELLLEWLKSNKMNNYITNVEKANWGEFKKELVQTDKGFVTKDGEVVEGVTLKENEDVFIVE
jgi:hypothetical protein